MTGRLDTVAVGVVGESRVARWGRLVAFSHSVFALPFAVMMIGIASRFVSVSWAQVLLLLVCVVSARTAAMAWNRIVDCEIDRRNPRTAGRELPSGIVSRIEAWGLAVLGAVLFLLASALLGKHCAVCAPFVLAVLFSYSFFKRFSSLCHIVLGIALACAPGGVWYALTGEFSWRPVPLMCGVMCWVAGFDIIYSIQDAEFDREHGLFSIPSRCGELVARFAAIALHVVALGALVLNGTIFDLGTFYYIGVVLFAASVGWQHVEVARQGPGVISRAFFTRNGVASVALCAASIVDLWR